MKPRDQEGFESWTNEAAIALEEQYNLRTYRKMPFAVDRGQGAWVWDVEGNRYLDFYGGHCVALLGHAHPGLARAIGAQARRLTFYSNAVYSPVRARTAKLICDLTPEPLNTVFFCSSGAEANETALKMARKASGKSVIAATEGGFHGRTLGALAATWPEGYRKGYEPVLSPVEFVPFGDAEAAEALLSSRDDIAAFILEPLQSMAGVTEASAEYFQRLRKACDASGTALVFDEVQTGVGRTGRFSICEHYGMVPDLITVAKGLGSGVPAGAVLISDAIAESVGYGDQGNTFGGGMIAMAAVEATLQALIDESLMEKALNLERRLRESLPAMGIQVRGKGALLGLVWDRPIRPLINALLARGVIIGGSADPNAARVMPPLVTTDTDIDYFLARVEEAIASLKAESHVA